MENIQIIFNADDGIAVKQGDRSCRWLSHDEALAVVARLLLKGVPKYNGGMLPSKEHARRDAIHRARLAKLRQERKQ